MRLTLACAALALASGPALAQCLDSGDLARGIVVTYENGDATTMRRVRDGSVQVDEAYADGSPSMRFRAVRGIYYVEEYQPGPDGKPVRGTGLEVIFPVDPATLPVPAAGATWTGETVNRFDDGTERAETTSATFTASPPILLGGCSYDALAVALRYDWGPEGGMDLDYLYLTDLGTAIILAKTYDGDKPSETVPVGLSLAGK